MRMRYLKQNKVLGVTTTTREKQRDKTAATKRENIKGNSDEKSKMENGVEKKSVKENEKIKEAMKGQKYEINAEHEINLESVTAI